MNKKLLIVLLLSLSTSNLLISAGHKDSVNPELVRASKRAESQRDFVKRLSAGRSRSNSTSPITPPSTPPRRKSQTPSPFGSPARLTLQKYELRSRSTSPRTSPQRKKREDRFTPPDSKTNSPDTSVSSETISLLSSPKRRLRTPSPLVKTEKQVLLPNLLVETEGQALKSYLLKELAEARASTSSLPVATPKATNPQQDIANFTKELIETKKRAPRIGLDPLERRSLSNPIESFRRIPEKIRQEIPKIGNTSISSAFQPSTLYNPVEEENKSRNMLSSLPLSKGTLSLTRERRNLSKFTLSAPAEEEGKNEPQSMFDTSRPKSRDFGISTIVLEEDDEPSDEEDISHIYVSPKQRTINRHNKTLSEYYMNDKTTHHKNKKVEFGDFKVESIEVPACELAWMHGTNNKWGRDELTRGPSPKSLE